MKGTVYIPDKNKILLRTSPGSERLYKDDRFLDIRADDLYDFTLCDAFNEIVFDLILTLSNGHVVLYNAIYSKIKSERRKWFGRGWSMPEYDQTGDTARLKQHLIDTGWKDGLFADIPHVYEYKFIGVKCRDDKKELCIVQERLDFELFRKACMCDKEGAWSTICIFPEAEICYGATDYETVRAYRESPDDMMLIVMNTLSPEGHVTVNPEHITVEAFIAKFKPIVERHNKVLEVNL